MHAIKQSGGLDVYKRQGMRGVLLAALFIAFSSGIVIYSVFYLSVSNQVSQIGQLKTIGTVSYTHLVPPHAARLSIIMPAKTIAKIFFIVFYSFALFANLFFPFGTCLLYTSRCV